MMTLIHVLGADIPHHNATLLRFFDQVLAVQQPVAAVKNFMVVAADPAALPRVPSLQIACYPNKKQLAQAVIAKAKSDRRIRFLFHGQFNPYIWLALLCGQVKPRQAYWHLWGADWYENSASWKFRLFYRIRRLAQRKIGHVFATQGDLFALKQRLPMIGASLLYFPTKMEAIAASGSQARQTPRLPTVLVGNSGDRSNRHIEALQALHRQFGAEVRLVIPLGYPENNQAYIEQVRAEAQALFPAEQVEILTHKLAFEDYLAVLERCDLGYFIYRRQQGIGTLLLLVQQNIPFVLHAENPFCHDLNEQQIPFLLSDQVLNLAVIGKTRQQLMMRDKTQVAFLPPNYIEGWHSALRILMEDV